MIALPDWNPARINRALDVLTVLVIVSVGVALAGLTWRLLGHAGTGAVTVPRAARPAPPPPDLAPALALAPFGKPAANGEGAPATTLAIELKGLMFARPASLSTAFIAAEGATKPYHVGEVVAGATIEAIETKRVLLRNGGRVESLGFPQPLAQATPAAPAPPTATGRPAGVAPPPAPSTAPPPLAGPPPADGTSAAVAMMQKFDARPVSGGYQVGANAPVGMQQGDVVQLINGAQLGNPEVARDAFLKAQQEGNAQIQILRDGKRLTLTVPIR
ncbi:type II secretion system protein N [Sphingomonas sp.]|uniref:type II secretion system protein N n=1 Tax=Sphingomonas sp. TaxID=28214 RepID=UPI002CFB2972|nr:type II secretion system protein N [Sphingomonas sp.]HWK35530.1 type II secretion system protein N [Sphingomonas sp.]